MIAEIRLPVPLMKSVNSSRKPLHLMLRLRCVTSPVCLLCAVRRLTGGSLQEKARCRWLTGAALSNNTPKAAAIAQEARFSCTSARAFKRLGALLHAVSCLRCPSRAEVLHRDDNFMPCYWDLRGEDAAGIHSLHMLRIYL